MSEKDLYQRLSGLISTAGPVRTPMRDAPLSSGQIRRLDPKRDGSGMSTLVLIADTPEPSAFPEDCFILHVVPLGSPASDATTRDVVLPSHLTGCPFELFAMVDMFTTMVLPVGNPEGRGRFGPCLGGGVDPRIAGIGWSSHLLPDDDLREKVETDFGLVTGVIPVQTGDNLWYRRVMECRNLNRLTA